MIGQEVRPGKRSHTLDSELRAAVATGDFEEIERVLMRLRREDEVEGAGRESVAVQIGARRA